MLDYKNKEVFSYKCLGGNCDFVCYMRVELGC